MRTPHYSRRVFLVKNLNLSQWNALKSVTQHSKRTHSDGFKFLVDNSIHYRQEALKFRKESLDLLEELERMYLKVKRYENLIHHLRNLTSEKIEMKQEQEPNPL